MLLWCFISRISCRTELSSFGAKHGRRTSRDLVQFQAAMFSCWQYATLLNFANLLAVWRVKGIPLAFWSLSSAFSRSHITSIGSNGTNWELLCDVQGTDSGSLVSLKGTIHFSGECSDDSKPSSCSVRCLSHFSAASAKAYEDQRTFSGHEIGTKGASNWQTIWHTFHRAQQKWKGNWSDGMIRAVCVLDFKR